MELKSITVMLENRSGLDKFLKLKASEHNEKMIYATVTNQKKIHEVLRKLKLLALKIEDSKPFFYLSTYEQDNRLKIVGTVYADGKLEEKVIVERKEYITGDMEFFDEKIFHKNLFIALNFIKFFKDNKKLWVPINLEYLGVISAGIGEMEQGRSTTKMVDVYNPEDVVSLLMNIQCGGKRLFFMLKSFPYLWKSLMEKNYNYFVTIPELATDEKDETINLLEVLTETTDRYLQDFILKEIALCFYANREVLKKELREVTYNWIDSKLSTEINEESILKQYRLEEISYGWKVAFDADENYDEILSNSLRQVKEYMDLNKNIDRILI